MFALDTAEHAVRAAPDPYIPSHDAEIDVGVSDWLS